MAGKLSAGIIDQKRNGIMEWRNIGRDTENNGRIGIYVIVRNSQ